jgi:HK97 family phage major capsid protein
MTDDVLVSFGTEIKALGDNKFGGYLVRFTSADDPDVVGDYFTSETDFDVEFPGKSTVYFNHGLDRNLKRRKLGKADMRLEDAGVWAEMILSERDEYEQELIKLAKAGKLGWSSGTAAHLVEREPEGKAQHITRWPLGLDASITHTPAEPRNEVVPLKSLSVLTIQPEPEPIKAETPAEVESVQETNTGVNTMEIDEIKLQEMLESSAAKGAEAAVEAMVKAAPSKKEPEIQVVEDEADRALKGNPFTDRDFFMAVKNAAFYPDAIDKRLLPLKATGMNEAIPSQGGFLVRGETASGILENMYATGTLLGLFNRIPVEGNALSVPAVDETSRANGSRYGGVRGYWMAEGGEITGSKPAFRTIDLKLKKVAALVVGTDELFSDAGALSAWIGRTVPNELRFMVEDAIINADGVGKPLGILSSPALKSAVRTDASEIDALDIGRMWAGRFTGYNDYVWLFNKNIFPQMLTLSIGQQPVFLPAGGMGGLPYSTLLGRPAYEVEYLPTLGTLGDIMLVSPSAYLMIEKSSGVEAASSIHVYFTAAEEAFRFIYRVDGQPAWYSALTEKDATTSSPYVVLAATT